MFLGNNTANLQVASVLNFELKNEYIFTFRAFDMGIMRRYSKSATINITIEDLTDHPPSFLLDNYFIDISENSAPGTFIIKVCYLSNS